MPAQAAKTLALSQRFPSNVIQLTEENVEHVLVGKSRPYHVVILAGAMEEGMLGIAAVDRVLGN